MVTSNEVQRHLSHIVTPTMTSSTNREKHKLSKSLIDVCARELQASSLYRQASVWRRHLKYYPDPEVRDRVLEGISNGFSIRASGEVVPAEKAQDNHRSAQQDADFISQRIHEEIELGRYLHVPDHHSSNVVVAPIGLVPKHPSGYRLIHDLSAARSSSVNAAIDPEDARTQYGTMEEAIRFITALKGDIYLAKIDFKDAFRHCRVRPDEVQMLGLRWQGNTYVDLCLPFGLRSSPAVFNELAHVALWVAKRIAKGIHRGVQFEVVHYLDDYLLITVGRANAMNVMATCMETFRELGLHLNNKKCIDPCRRLTFLGVELDVVARTARLPQDKQQALLEVVGTATTKTRFTKRELLSLAGQLFHAAKVVKPGRTFTASLLQQAYTVDNLYTVIVIPTNSQLVEDLYWWHHLLSGWNGVAFYDYTRASAGRDLHLAIKVGSDASSTIGFGLICGDEWTHGVWSARSRDYPIHIKELIPLVMAAMLWGARWSRKQVVFECDNMAVVAVVNDGYPKDRTMRRYLRQLWLCAVQHGFLFSAVHVPGVLNVDADDLSRGRVTDFLTRNASRHVRPEPLALSPELLDALQL